MLQAAENRFSVLRRMVTQRRAITGLSSWAVEQFTPGMEAAPNDGEPAVFVLKPQSTPVFGGYPSFLGLAQSSQLPEAA